LKQQALFDFSSTFFERPAEGLENVMMEMTCLFKRQRKSATACYQTKTTLLSKPCIYHHRVITERKKAEESLQKRNKSVLFSTWSSHQCAREEIGAWVSASKKRFVLRRIITEFFISMRSSVSI